MPQYNDVDLSAWKPWDIKELGGTQELKCEPDSNRISIDEMTRFNPINGRLTINTGAGQDMLSINGRIKGTGDQRDGNFIVADLGEVC